LLEHELVRALGLLLSRHAAIGTRQRSCWHITKVMEERSV
jgi:hypothetical protein